MAIFNRLTKAEIRSNFTHTALYCGIVPVYINMRNSDCPDVAVRNWLPEFLLDIMDFILYPVEVARSAIDPDYESLFAFKLTGLIEDGLE